MLYNNADKQYSSQMTSTNAIVTSDGNITWFSSAIFKSSCSINVEYFPFDEQTCTLKFASWTYDGLKLDLISTSNTTDLSNYVANGEWDLVVASVQRNVVFYSCCEEPYPDVTYHFVLRRRPLFYGKFLKYVHLLTQFYSFQFDPTMCFDNGNCFNEFLHAFRLW